MSDEPEASPPSFAEVLRRQREAKRATPTPAAPDQRPATPAAPVGGVFDPPAARLHLVGRTSAYGARVLERCCADVRAKGEGGRNAELNATAYLVGHYVAGGEVDEADALRELTAAALDAGLEPSETAATIASGLRSGRATPKRAPERAPGEAGLPGAALPPPVPPAPAGPAAPVATVGDEQDPSSYGTVAQPSSGTVAQPNSGTDDQEHDGTSAPPIPVDQHPATVEARTAYERLLLRARTAARQELDAEAAAARLAEQRERGVERLVDGASFVLDAPDTVPAVWGGGDEVLWAQGESLLLVGPPGVGKTTLAQQVVAGRLGVFRTVLGYPVAPTQGRLLYLACDRPPQIARSLRRLLSAEHEELLRERLVVWKGPPPADLARNPDVLRQLCADVGAGTVVVDSLKDVALGLSEDEVGAGYNAARQRALAEGVEVLELHHQTKRGGGGTGLPTSLADVYGSGWITAGAGSVVLLWGAAGDPVVELRHLKQPADDVGPFRIEHDHVRGVSGLWRPPAQAPVELAARPSGLTVVEYAAMLYGNGEPSPSDLERARRKLGKLVADGELVTEERAPGTSGGRPTTVYRAAS